MTESGREVGLASADAGFRDEGTGTLFTLDGRGVEGPLAGEVLVPLAETYVAYRGAWLEFHPDSRIWGG